MFQFEKISANQLLVFSQVLSESALLQIELIEARFVRTALNFPETVEFLKELELVSVLDNEFVSKPKYKILLDELRKSQHPLQVMKSFIISCLLNSEASFSEYVYKFLSQFHWVNGQCEFTPNASQRLEYSGLRNFLIDMEFLYLDSSKTKYIISEDYLLLLADLKKPQQLSPDGFLKVQQKRGEIGKAAELKIIEYEKQRLSGFPHLVEKIEHRAIKDVMAGYDIRSFEDTLDDRGNSTSRFIEVKAVSPWDYRFYWSKNEIESAILHQKTYYLYLLPVVGKNEFDINRLKIINDPYSNVYKNNSEWVRTDEVIAFSTCKD